MVSGQDGQENAIDTNKCACIAEMGWHKKEDDSGCGEYNWGEGEDEGDFRLL